MMNKLLFTGATGFLGKNILSVLRELDYEVTTLGNPTTDIVCDISKKVPEFVRCFDLVVHAAGKAHIVPKSDFEKQEFFNVNVKGTENLLQGLEKAKYLPKQFVFISSVSVYGLDYGTNINENQPLLAKDPYGQSKIKAEELVQGWCDKNKIVCTIIRLPLLVGKHPPGNLGAMVKAISKGYYFNIDGGKAKKSMVLAKDVAYFIAKVASVGGIFNLTDSIHPSFFELSLAIGKKKFFSLPLFFAKMMGKMGDVLGDKSPITSLKVKKITSDLTFDDSKARVMLDWKPESVLSYLNREELS